jgi:hypothetical protein
MPVGDHLVALDRGQSQPSKPAPDEGILSFPQASAFIWKRDAGNVTKIQDIVVSC